MADKIIDFTKLARKAVRSNRCPNDGHDYKLKRNGHETCTKCGDHFPCKKLCQHINCWERRLTLGEVEHYPTEYAIGGLIQREADGTITYDTTADDPVEWTLPVGEYANGAA